jgi:hypothetical protein
MRWLLIASLAACGRIGFEVPVPDDTPGPSGPYFVEDFQDGDFIAAPSGETGMFCVPGNCGSMLAEIREDADGRWLRITRTGAPPDGGGQSVSYPGLARPVGETLRLRYRTRPVFDQINNGGSFCVEYGVVVTVRLTLVDATAVSLHYVHNYGTSQCLNDNTWRYSSLPMNAWSVLDHDLSEHLTTIGLAPAARLEQIDLASSGWNFETHFDDITIVP